MLPLRMESFWVGVCWVCSRGPSICQGFPWMVSASARHEEAKVVRIVEHGPQYIRCRQVVMQTLLILAIPLFAPKGHPGIRRVLLRAIAYVRVCMPAPPAVTLTPAYPVHAPLSGSPLPAACQQRHKRLGNLPNLCTIFTSISSWSP